jgi:hypothetical protein
VDHGWSSNSLPSSPSVGSKRNSKMKIYLIDPGTSDGFPGLVKEIVREKAEAFDLIKFTDKYDQDSDYVYDETIKDDIVCRLVIRVARISEKRNQA